MFEPQLFIGEERRQEFIHQAEKNRLVREALEASANDRHKSSSFYRLALAKIGLGLIAIGTPLAERYDKTSIMRVDARWSHERG